MGEKEEEEEDNSVKKDTMREEQKKQNARGPYSLICLQSTLSLGILQPGASCYAVRSYWFGFIGYYCQSDFMFFFRFYFFYTHTDCAYVTTLSWYASNVKKFIISLPNGYFARYELLFF